MENASKALIIAGSILLALLIIGLGMGIFNNIKDYTSPDLSSEQVQAFNSKFDSYVGDSVKGSRAKALCDAIKNNNLTADFSETYGIGITYKPKTGSATTLNIPKDTSTRDADAQTVNTIKNFIKNGNLYKITAAYSTEGLINAITIEALS